MIDKFKVKRIRKRVYPKPNKVGIRASQAGEIFHIDMSIVKLRGLSKVYLQAVVAFFFQCRKKFSRYVLAFDVFDKVSGGRTADLLQRALHNAKRLGIDRKPALLSDSGCENVNSDVNAISSLFLRHDLAQIDIHFSNSMIEAFFRKIKNSHLYYKTMDTMEDVYEQCKFFIEQHNDIVPLRSLNGGTPKEIFTSAWLPSDIERIKSMSQQVVKNRFLSNRNLICSQCNG